MRFAPRRFSRCLAVFCLAVVASAAAQTVASAQVSVVQEIALPERLSAPFSIAVDKSGRVWFTEKVGKNLTVFDPEGKEFKDLPLPLDWGNMGPSRIALGPRGKVWFTVRRWAESSAKTDILGEFVPGDGSFTKHPLAGLLGADDVRIDRPPTVPEDLAVDGKGMVWFLAPAENKVYRFDPAGPALKGYPIPTQNSYPRGISIGANGVIWFTEANVNKIGKLDPETSAFSEYDIPTPFATPGETAIDGKGRLWFVEMTANRIGVFYPDRERFDEAIVPTPRGLPNAIAAGEDGRIWFLEYRANKIAVFDPIEALFREYDIPTYNSLPGDMAIDLARGRIWFSESNTEVKRLGVLSIAAAASAVVGATAPGEAGGPTARADFPGGAIAAGLLLLAVIAGGGGVFLVVRGRKDR